MHKNAGLVGVGLLAALLATGCTTPPAQKEQAFVVRSMPRSEDLIAAQVRENFPAYLKASRAIFFTGTTQTCTNLSDCPVTITLTTVDVGDKVYCIARVPETIKFGNTHPNNSEKTITWTLNETTLRGRDVEFHEQEGILMVDGHNQFNPKKPRLSKQQFQAKNKHKVTGSATYVPIIIFRTQDNIPELCAAGDPKIENN